MRYWVHASAEWDELPPEWIEDLGEDVEDCLRFLGGRGVTVEVKKEGE